jgi:hypothetical protein
MAVTSTIEVQHQLAQGAQDEEHDGTADRYHLELSRFEAFVVTLLLMRER